MNQLKQILELLKDVDRHSIEIMGLWSQPSVSELLKSPEIKSNNFITIRLSVLEKYFQNIYIYEHDITPYLQPMVLQVLKQIIYECKPTKIVKRFP